MKFPGAHKPSLIILGRTTLALVVLGVAAFSFAVGYLVGYNVMPLSASDQPVLGKPDAKPIPPDEKRVLEPTPLPAVPPAQQQQTVKTEKEPEPLVSIKPSAPEAATARSEQQPAAEQKKPEPKVAMGDPVEQKPKPEEPKKTAGAAPEKTKTERKPDAKAQQQPVAAGKVAEKPQDTRKSVEAQKAPEAKGKKAAKKATVVKGAYAIQFGAFADSSKASALKAELAKKGVKAYILPKDKKSSYARVRAGGFATHAEAAKYAASTEARTGFAGFVTKR